MSFLGSYKDAQGIINEIEESNDVGLHKGKPSSNLLTGTDDPEFPKSPTPTLEMSRTTPKTATNTLKRKG
jgi:hypothetical protein